MTIEARHTEEGGAVVVPYENGPLLIRGDFTLLTPDGEEINPGRRTVALCRCGRSALKPFCDGTHKAIGFKAGTGRETPAPRDLRDETTTGGVIPEPGSLPAS